MKEKIIKTKVGQLFVSYQPAEKIAVFLSGAGSLPTYENFLPVIRKLPENWGYLTIDYPNAGQSLLENQESFSVADFKILREKAERSSDRLKSVQEGFQHYCSIAKSDFQNLDISFQFPIFILIQAYREQEYKDSEFASQNTQIILGGSHHYLHWSESEKIAELLLEM